MFPSQTGIKDAKMMPYGTVGDSSVEGVQLAQTPAKVPDMYKGVVSRIKEYILRPKTGVFGRGMLKSPRNPFAEIYQPAKTANSNRPTRNNNPLNIKYSEYTKTYDGVMGIDSKNITDGGRGFIVFKTPEHGFKAAERLLRSEGYQGMTVDQAMKRWSNNGYDGSIVPYIKNKPVEQLLPSEMRELILTMAKREGYSPNLSQGSFTGGKQYRPRSLGVITTIPWTATKYEKSHPGVDIANKPGTPIPSFVKGTVVEVVNNQSGSKNGYGNYIIVKDTDGNMHRYSHLSNSYVKVGQPVGRGTTIGTMGNTGAAYSEGGAGDGTHLDYRIVSAYGKYLNPMTYIKYLS